MKHLLFGTLNFWPISATNYDNWVSDRFLLIFALPDHYLIMGRHHLVGVTVPTGTAGLGLVVYSKI